MKCCLRIWCDLHSVIRLTLWGFLYFCRGLLSFSRRSLHVMALILPDLLCLILSNTSGTIVSLFFFRKLVVIQLGHKFHAYFGEWDLLKKYFYLFTMFIIIYVYNSFWPIFILFHLSHALFTVDFKFIAKIPALTHISYLFFIAYATLSSSRCSLPLPKLFSIRFSS